MHFVYTKRRNEKTR